MPTRRSIHVISIQSRSERCKSRKMHKDINNQIQKIVYLIIFQISYTRTFACNFAIILEIL